VTGRCDARARPGSWCARPAARVPGWEGTFEGADAADIAGKASQQFGLAHAMPIQNALFAKP
jgi:hypothetical protein